jgi:hypothetical protein
MNFAHCLNRTVLVSIPAFFGDDKARACTLVNIDAAGLWLACDDLKNRLGPAQEIAAAWTSPITGFFPFSQILYVVDPTQFAVLARGGQRPMPPRPTAPAPPKAMTREDSPRGGRPKQKKSNPKR